MCVTGSVLGGIKCCLSQMRIMLRQDFQAVKQAQHYLDCSCTISRNGPERIFQKILRAQCSNCDPVVADTFCLARLPSCRLVRSRTDRSKAR